MTTENTNDDAALLPATCSALFAREYPCIYKGAIPCSECELHPRKKRDPDDGCDMAAGRELKEAAFKRGFELGQDNQYAY